MSQKLHFSLCQRQRQRGWSEAQSRRSRKRNCLQTSEFMQTAWLASLTDFKVFKIIFLRSIK